MKKVSVLFIVFFLILVTQVSSETSYYANKYGMLVEDDYGVAASMGDAGSALSGYSNMMRRNPSLLSGFKKAYYVGRISYNRNKSYTNGADDGIFAETLPDYLKIILPLPKNFVFGWGLAPYSRTDVKIKFKNDEYIDTCEFTGGLNVSTTTIAYSYKDFLSLGMSFDYNFGSINEDWNRTFVSDDDYENTETEIKHKFKGYSKTFGAIIKPVKKVSFGFGYTQESDLKRQDLTYDSYVSNSDKEYGNNTYKLPASWNVGVAYAGRKLAAAADYKVELWENAAITETEKELYNDSYMFGMGIRYLHTDDVLAPYLMKVPVSIGFKIGTLYLDSYPAPKENPVYEKAITAGLEFPIAKTKGSVITSFELGKRGDKSKNGWDENYFELNILLVGIIK